MGIGGITTSASGNTVTINGSGIISNITLNTDVGGPLTGSTFTLTGSNIYTSGSGSTVSYNLQGTNHSLFIGRGNLSPSISLGVATNGQIPIGSSLSDPVLATLTAGTGISITNGPGSITLAASAATPLSFPTDSGTAVPSSNLLNLRGQSAYVGIGGIQATSTGGNTVDYRMLSPYSIDNFNFENNTAATKRVLSVVNNVADGSSDSVLRANVNGASTSDPYLQVVRGATMCYCWGIDTSDSNTLKICADANSNTATPSGGTLLYKMTSGGAASYVSGNVDVTRGNGTTVSHSIVNSSALGGNAFELLQVESTNNTGDPYVRFVVNGGNQWSLGVDNSDNDSFQLVASSVLGGNQVIYANASNGNVSFLAGNTDTTHSSSGGNVTNTISNTSNTASSFATQIISVGGISAGDPQLQFTNQNNTWTTGLDNSNSGVYSISASASLGTTEIVQVSVPGDLTINSQRNGSSGTIIYQNANNTAGSGVQLQLKVAGSTADDAYTRYTINGVSEWSTGIDNSVTGDPYVISRAGSLGTNNAISIDANAISFLAGQVVNVTRPGVYPYTVLSTDYLVSVDTSGAAPTVNLPASPVNGETHIVKDRSANASVSNITVSGNGHNIVGSTSAASQTISLNGASVTYVYDSVGTIWLAI